MSQDSLEKLSELLKQRNFPAAEKIIKDYFGGELSPKDQAAQDLMLIGIYVKAMNSFNRQHLETLNTAIAELKKINQAEQKLDEQDQVAKTRGEIAAS